MIVALAAALVLLSSGLGTSARWYEELRFADDPITVNSGELGRYPTDTRFEGLTACTAPQGFAHCAEASAAQVRDFRFMRGDRLTVESRFDVTATGTNLRYAITVTPLPQTPSPGWTSEDTVTPGGVLTGAQTVTVERTLEFSGPVGAGDWAGAFGDVTVPDIAVQAIQEDR
ncbi:hypothetical protein [Brevibacterium sanguinis]|uniref:hypothetical protein n=1 Tax=Brevibacterium sanguinis TaxID=232444 RepID=UPI0031D4ABDC